MPGLSPRLSSSEPNMCVDPGMSVDPMMSVDPEMSVDPMMSVDPGSNAEFEQNMCVEPDGFELGPTLDMCVEDGGMSMPLEDGGVCEMPEPVLDGGMSVEEAPVCETPSLDMTEEGAQCVEITEPTRVMSSMGEMMVYPDSWQGELPPGAVLQSHHDRMQSVYDRIDAGESQVGIDTSNFTAGIDPAADPEGYAAALAEADEFRSRNMGYLRDLMATGVGMDFMEELDTADHTISISEGSDGNVTRAADPAHRADRGNGTGADTSIVMNSNKSTYQDPGEDAEGWMDDRQQFGLYHELVHAYQNVHGTRASGSTEFTAADGSTDDINNSELQAMGYGEYGDNTYTDNVFREAMGKETRPRYGGYVAGDHADHDHGAAD